MTEDKLTVDDKIAIKELEESIVKMKEDKEKKCKSSKEQLIEMLKVTVDKYRTATGAAEALRILRFTNGERENIPIYKACRLANAMAKETNRMLEKARKLSYAEMDQLCDGFYDKEFEAPGSSFSDDAYQLAFEMMRIDLCRNVGPATEDLVEFIKSTQEAIDRSGEELKELRNKPKNVKKD